MAAIYKRELKSCFHSFIGFLFIAVNLFFLGLYFTVYNLIYGYPYFSYAINSVLFLFFISIPVLTMRILAEERKQKTDQLILTAPVSVGAVVMGKFLALVTVFAVPVAIICLYPLILSAYGSVPLSETYIAILAFFLYGLACIAIGLFISSLTESQVIAAVLSFGFLFLGYMMSSICSLISATGNLLTRLLGCFDLYTAFNDLNSGTLNLESIAYFLSVTALMLFLTVQSIQKRRYSVSGRTISVSAYSTGMIAIAVAVVVVFNLAVEQLPAGIRAVDVTSSKLYSLTAQTKDYLDTLTEEVTIYVLANENSADIILAQTLDRYEEYSGHITVEYVDPTVNPRFHTQYTDSSVSMNSLIVVSSKRSIVVDSADIYQSEIDYTTYSYVNTGYDGEGRITSAIDYVLSEDIPKVYMTSGHDEYPLDTGFSSGLEKENVDYETITLLDYESIPEDAAMLFIHSPATDFSAEDAEKVIAYLEQGGNVVVVVGYTDADMTNFKSLLSYMGITVTDGLVIEGSSDNHYYGSQYMLFPNMTDSIYTQGIYGSYYIYAPYSQGILIEDEAAEDMSYTTILYTSEEAFAREGVENQTNMTKAEGDLEGPFKIGVKAEKSLEDATATMVVYSCDMLFTDYISQQVSGANCKLFLNTASSFTDVRESSISVPVKAYELSSITMTSSNVVFLGVLTIVVMPLALLLIGFAIWFGRRKR